MLNTITTARRARGLLTAFTATAATHLGSLLTDSKVIEQVTKPALMPLLAGHVRSAASAGRIAGATSTATERPALRLLTPALLTSAAGDALLQVDDERAFLAGMGSFAAAHICYVTMFAKQGALTDRRRTALVAAGYALAWAVMIHQLWPGLGELKGPVAATACCSPPPP